MKIKTVWFARTTDIARMGPYPTQVAAAAALMAVHHGPHCRGRYGECWPQAQLQEGCAFHPAAGSLVWPEEVGR
jgi:hypothetical protein